MRLQKLKGELVDRVLSGGDGVPPGAAGTRRPVDRRSTNSMIWWFDPAHGCEPSVRIEPPAGWPARVAAMMAADLGIGAHAMQTVLESHVRQHLGELADLRTEFR